MLASQLALSLLCCSGERRAKEDPEDDKPPKRSRSAESSAKPRANKSAEPLAAAGPALLEGKSVQAVISGVLSWQDPGLASFDKRARKDLELARLLQTQKGAQVERLLDEQATRANIKRELEQAAAKVRPDGVLIFYYAGHGVRGPSGTVYFASHDLDLNNTDETGLSMRDVQDSLSKAPRGARVLLLADCCYSGELETVARALNSQGLVAASLASAESSNLSTANWTFTQTLLDSLAGEALADRDADGLVELGEVAQEVRDAMKFREQQRAGIHLPEGLQAWPLSKAINTAAAPDPKRGNYFKAPSRKGPRVGRVVETEQEQATVRFFSYAAAWDEKLETGALKPIRFASFAEGTDLTVTWQNKNWPARVTKRDGDFMRITYPGWPSYWDEWVLDDRIVR